MRQELKLTSYTVQAVVWHCLRERLPEFDCHLLSAWYHGYPTVGSHQQASSVGGKGGHASVNANHPATVSAGDTGQIMLMKCSYS